MRAGRGDSARWVRPVGGWPAGPVRGRRRGGDRCRSSRGPSGHCQALSGGKHEFHARPGDATHVDVAMRGLCAFGRPSANATHVSPRWCGRAGARGGPAKRAGWRGWLGWRLGRGRGPGVAAPPRGRCTSDQHRPRRRIVARNAPRRCIGDQSFPASQRSPRYAPRARPDAHSQPARRSRAPANPGPDAPPAPGADAPRSGRPGPPRPGAPQARKTRQPTDTCGAVRRRRRRGDGRGRCAGRGAADSYETQAPDRAG
jgi:hypothetical protein